MKKNDIITVLLGMGCLILLAGVVLSDYCTDKLESPPWFIGIVVTDGSPYEGNDVRAVVEGTETNADLWWEGGQRHYVVDAVGTTAEGNTITLYVDASLAYSTDTWECGMPYSVNLIVGTPPAGCSIGVDCSIADCTNWVYITDSDGITQQVRDSDGDTKYDQACCGGIVNPITVYYS